MSKKREQIIFYVSLCVVFAIVLLGIFVPEGFGNVADSIHDFLVNNFSWFYLLSMFAFVVFALFLAFSKYGNIKLGPDDSKPEYSNFSWFAMLFATGMGIGLVFWGVAEPLNHFVNPVGAEPGTAEAADFAMRTSFLHWGFHPWANYAIIGLALAYFQFRKNAPGLISSLFLPLLGRKGVEGPIGILIDILAVFATVAGVATSLGMGTLQINAGMNYLFDLPMTSTVQVIIIAITTALFITSAVSGIDKGIKALSNANLIIISIILIATFLIGPTVTMINALVNGFGQYAGNFIEASFHIDAFGDSNWLGDWTIFYWAWWIAWAPFVGSFFARISRGRTIREFILGVILAPTLVSFIWFSIFGTLGIDLGLDIATEAIAVTETAFFMIVQNYPLGNIIALVTVFSLCIFFVTSADSATFVLGMFTSNGNLNPSNGKKILWGLVQSLLALALLLAGGLAALQTTSIVAAFPFAFVMLFAMVSMVKAFREEKIVSNKKKESKVDEASA